MKAKPTKKQVIVALEILLKWATGSDKHNNPYCYPAVQHALTVLGREQGESDWINVDPRNLPIPKD